MTKRRAELVARVTAPSQWASEVRLQPQAVARGTRGSLGCVELHATDGGALGVVAHEDRLICGVSDI